MNNLILNTLGMSCTFLAFLLGCNNEGSALKLSQTPANSSVKFYIASNNKKEGMIKLRVWEDIAINEDQILYISKSPFMTGSHVADVKLGMNQQNSYVVMIKLSAEGRDLLLQATTKANNGMIAILRDTTVLGAPYFSGPIDSQHLEISQNMTPEQCKLLQKSLVE